MGGFPNFEAMELDDVNAAAEGRTTELYDSPLKSGEADARTPPKEGSPTKSPTKKGSHKPPQKVIFTPLEDAARMVAEKQKNGALKP